MELNRLEIYGKDFKCQHIYLDGKELKCITKAEIKIDAKKMPEVILYMCPDELIIDGIVDNKIAIDKEKLADTIGQHICEKIHKVMNS